jgi:hypothetical protein
MRPLREDQRALQQRDRIERLRRMSPEARREALRQLSPEERRALMEAWQQRRAQRLGREAPAIAPQIEPAPAASDLPQPGMPEAESPR